MFLKTLEGVLVPFLGTTLGAACVFFMKGSNKEKNNGILTGFAGGVMIAASVFSLIIPAIEQSERLGRFAFIPASVGFLTGVFFLVLIDNIIPFDGESGENTDKVRTLKLSAAVTIHNLPEGMAVGIIYAGCLFGKGSISFADAFALSVGIALQNFPEGAIVSMPLSEAGMSKGRAFLYGSLSGIVEPAGAVLTLFAARFFLPLMPYFLSFAAGAMFYVVIEELIPGKSEGNPTLATVFFALGFLIMLALDTGL